MKNDRRIRDAKLRNSRPTRQERIRMKIDSNLTFEEAHEKAVEEVKKKKPWLFKSGSEDQ